VFKILAVDPSGTGTTGICLINQTITFQEFQAPDWKAHLTFIQGLIHQHQPQLLLYENTHYIHHKNQDSLGLFRLLGAIESLPIKTEHILVNPVKELKKQLFKKTKLIPHLAFKFGSGWFYQTHKISLHQLDAFLVYWLWKDKELVSSLPGRRKEHHA